MLKAKPSNIEPTDHYVLASKWDDCRLDEPWTVGYIRDIDRGNMQVLVASMRDASNEDLLACAYFTPIDIDELTFLDRFLDYPVMCSVSVEDLLLTYRYSGLRKLCRELLERKE